MLNIVINKSILFQELPSTIFDRHLLGSNETYLGFIVEMNILFTRGFVYISRHRAPTYTHTYIHMNLRWANSHLALQPTVLWKNGYSSWIQRIKQVQPSRAF